ncbi:type II toxin-antitoxin system HicB family antitoxin [Candidatus Saccharibacteria bacterium]|nr:MAG: type II toxin-antitoxin system HicB family antitoxin [Candidatus Saccharibacteria bacterium]
MSNKQSQTVNITLPKALLKEIDAIAKRDYTSRSDIIRQTLLHRIRAQKQQTSVDEWGDDGDWTTLVDFREINANGVPVRDVVHAIEEIIAEK